MPEPTPGSWVLRPESTDDDGLRTTFQLRYVNASGAQVAIGHVKILRTGQQASRTSLDATFDHLGPEYVSVGAELEYYKNLREVAGSEAVEVLLALADAAIDPVRRARFEAEAGFQNSLLRFTPARLALEQAATIFGASTSPPSSASGPLIFRTSTGGDLFDVSFEMNLVPDLPGRINVLVGSNGSGKTRLLSNLALAAFAPADTDEARSWGSFNAPLNFSRVLAFSYSALDDFDVPAVSGRERAAFLRADSGLGYMYFGLRDLTEGRAVQAPASALKSVRQVRNEFQRAVKAAFDEDGPLFLKVLNRLFAEPSFASIGVRPLATSTEPRQLLERTFSHASTGHKFVLLMTAQLCGFVRDGSLVLIDEPESHLHPPLLAAFVRVLRQLLEAKDSHAIVATHSSYVVQETPSSYVRIIRRAVNRTKVTPPSIETYGEDIATITRDIFRLDSEGGDFVGVLEELAHRRTLAQLEALFPRGLSGQARAIVMAIQARRGRA